MEYEKYINTVIQIIKRNKNKTISNAKEENFKNIQLVEQYGEDIYKTIYSVIIYKKTRDINTRILVNAVEDNKKMVYGRIVSWFASIMDIIRKRDLIDEEKVCISAPCILTFLVEEIGIVKTYEVLCSLFDNDIQIAIEPEEKKVERDIDVLQFFDEVDEELEELYTALSLDEDYLTLNQAYESISTKFSRECSITENNIVLQHIGEYIFNMLASEHIISKYVGLDKDEFLFTKGLMLDEVIMSKKITWKIHSINKRIISPNNLSLWNMEKHDDIIDVCDNLFMLKSVMACLFINYIERNNNKIHLVYDDLFRKYANRSFDPPELVPKNYELFLCYFAEVNGLEFMIRKKKKKHYVQVKNTLHNGVKIFVIILKNVEQTSIAKNILECLSKKWKKEWGLKDEFNIYIDEDKRLVYSDNEIEQYDETRNDNRETNISAKKMECQQSSGDKSEARLKLYAENKPKPVNYESRDDAPEKKNHIIDTKNFNEQNNVLYIMKGKAGCMIKKHDVIAATGTLVNLRRRTVKLNINYCVECNRFFIDYNDFKKYCDFYGPLLGNYSLKYMDFHKQENIYWADESPLHVCGYNVNQQTAYSDSERRKILANIIDYGIMNKPNIIEYLHFFIKNNGKRKNMRMAVSKWEDDLDFVHHYKMDQQKNYKISRVK